MLDRVLCRTDLRRRRARSVEVDDERPRHARRAPLRREEPRPAATLTVVCTAASDDAAKKLIEEAQAFAAEQKAADDFTAKQIGSRCYFNLGSVADGRSKGASSPSGSSSMGPTRSTTSWNPDRR